MFLAQDPGPIKSSHDEWTWVGWMTFTEIETLDSRALLCPDTSAIFKKCKKALLELGGNS